MQQKPRYPGGEINIPQFDFKSINPKIIYGAVAAIGVIWVLSGIYFVGQQEEGVVRRFGKFIEKVGPGPHYKLPWPMDKVDKPKVEEIRGIEIGFRTLSPGTASSPARYQQVSEESLMLTGDENIVDLDVIVQYRIRDAVNYLFKVRNPDQTVRNAAEAAIRSVIGKNTIDDALTENKTAIQNNALLELQATLDEYEAGIYIVAVNLQDVQPPEEVADSFRDVARAIQDKNRLINEAQGYRNDLIPRTRGEAEQQIRQAEAYGEERVRRSQGDIDRFLSILLQYNKSKDVTKKRLYIETMEKILPGMEKYIIQSDNGGGILNLIQLNKGEQ